MKTEGNRLYNLDIIKAIAIIAMVICHPVMRLGEYIPGYEDDFPYFFADVILGDYVIVAHGFMFAMGVGMIYTSKSDPSDMLRRGIKLYLMGYALNFLRYGVYVIIYDLFQGEVIDLTWQALFVQGILKFAGLAFILTAVLKKMGLSEVHILVVSIVLSAIGSFTPDLSTGSHVLDFLAGHFVSAGELSAFTLFNWYICVAFGRLMGSRLQKVQDKDRFYKRALVISGVIMVVYLALSLIYGAFFLTADRDYYRASTLEMMGLLSIDVFALSTFYFILKKTVVSRFAIFIEMSRNITAIYFIHWMILGATESVFCLTLEYVFTYTQIYLYAAALLIVSVYLARLWRARRRRHRQ